MRQFLALVAALGGTWLTPAAAAAPLLGARTNATTSGLPAGETQLANGAIAYRPLALGPGPAPLIILLHGAGGYPTNFLQALEPVADRLGFVMMFPHSEARTWDFILRVGAEQDPWRGRDLRRLDESLADLFRRAAIDPGRVVLLGFSDGASYALSLGVPNWQLFSAVVALSPGIYVSSGRASGRQRVFVAHGRADHVLSFDTTNDTIVRELRGEGVKLRFRPFAGGHEIEPEVLAEALDFALGLQASPPPPTSSSK